MHPNALLDCCTELLKQVLKFDHPADMVVSRYFREMRLGPRERATVAETIYGVLRKKNLYAYRPSTASACPSAAWRFWVLPRRAIIWKVP